IQFQVSTETGTVWLELRFLGLEGDTTLVSIRNITDLFAKLNSAEKFYNLTEQSHELIMITNVVGTIEYANPMVTEVTGYTNQELIGKNVAIFRSNKHNEDFYKNVWNTILNGKIFRAEFQNMKKDGEIYLEEKVITPISNME